MPRMVALVALAVLLPLAGGSADPPAAPLDYNRHVRPILADRCFRCHGPDEAARKADLRLDQGPAKGGPIVPGKPDESELVARITADDERRMPPAKSNLHLSPQEIDTLRRWVAEGAAYKPHWAFVPPPDVVPVPNLKSEISNLTSPLDAFVRARLDAENLTPSPDASRDDWLRRATFDLTGLPPTPADADAFLADESPLAYERVVDRLLASPRFGERLAADWLDAARYADSFGYQADGDMHVWPWRDWVVRSLNANLPFDQFLTWQLAGDLLPHATREQKLATAFNRLHRMTNEGGSIPEEWRNESVADRVHTAGTAVLGLTLECARCHDHKYDPIPQKDYYALGAFFNSIDEWGTYDSGEFRPSPTLPLPTPAQERELAVLAKVVAEREARATAVVRNGDGRFRHWLANPGAADIPGLVGHFPLDEIGDKNALVNLADATKPGITTAANRFAPGVRGKALRFTGDDPARFPKLLGRLDRDRPMTVAFWLRLPAGLREGIVFHRQAGTDTGFHGTECALDAGRLQFALVRFWPGNAAAIRTTDPLPAEEWIHIAVSHDGSGRAAGLRCAINGRAPPTEAVRDELTKDMHPDRGHGGDTGLTFGERFRSVGLRGALLDELRVYDRMLSPVEIAHLHDGRALAEALERRDETLLRPYYFAAVDAEAKAALAELRAARTRLFAAQTAVFDVMTMRETPTPRPAFVLRRGEYDAPKTQPVGRDTPSALPPFPAGAPRDRLGLARWLTDPRHPLTARVAVNRVWQGFFGRGLVATPENFGLQGALPSHPELLDWLARDFIDGGWDVKRLCRTIVLSATYRQRSAATPTLRERDPHNVLLARGPSRRLAAESLRDAALAAGGLLAERLGGPPAKPYQPAGLWRATNSFLPEYVPDKGEGLYRRSLYTFWRRTSPPPNMLAFDAPGREVCAARRSTTATPLQPLVLLNDPQFVEAARGLGERMLRVDGPTDERVTFAFRAAATRRPTEREVRLLVDLYAKQLDLYRADPDAAAKALRVGERPPPADLDAAELAAAAAVASAVLNLDAAAMVR